MSALESVVGFLAAFGVVALLYALSVCVAEFRRLRGIVRGDRLPPPHPSTRDSRSLWDGLWRR